MHIIHYRRYVVTQIRHYKSNIEAVISVRKITTTGEVLLTITYANERNVKGDGSRGENEKLNQMEKGKEKGNRGSSGGGGGGVLSVDEMDDDDSREYTQPIDTVVARRLIMPSTGNTMSTTKQTGDENIGRFALVFTADHSKQLVFESEQADDVVNTLRTLAQVSLPSP